MRKAIAVIILGLMLSGCQTMHAEWQPVLERVRVTVPTSDAADYELAKKMASEVCASKNRGSGVKLYYNDGEEGYGYVYRFECSQDLKRRDAERAAAHAAAIEQAKRARANLIASAKRLCRDLGISEDTEQFANCTTKIVAAEIGKQVIIQQGSSSSSSSSLEVIEGPVKCKVIDASGTIRCKDSLGRTIKHK